MVKRLRPLCGAIAAAVLLVALAAMPVAERVDSGASTVAAVRVSSSPSFVGDRAPAPSPLRGFGFLRSAGVADVSMVVSMVVSLFVIAGIVGSVRRRVGDHGENWRALLLGAPPAAV